MSAISHHVFRHQFIHQLLNDIWIVFLPQISTTQDFFQWIVLRKKDDQLIRVYTG